MAKNAKYVVGHPEQQKITTLLVNNLIVRGSLPLSIVEADWFREFMIAANARYTLPSRSHLTGKLLPQLSEATVARVLSHIAGADQVSLTLDIWTDRRMHAFLAVTGHTYIECECQSLLLTFEAFRGSHTGQNIAEAIDRCIEKYKLRDKVHYIVTDNATNMRKAFSVLEELAVDIEIESAGIDDQDLWNDLDSTDLEDVSFSCLFVIGLT